MTATRTAKKSIGLISRKKSLHVQHTFCSFLPSYTFYGGNVAYVFLFAFFFTTAYFHTCVCLSIHFHVDGITDRVLWLILCFSKVQVVNVTFNIILHVGVGRTNGRLRDHQIFSHLQHFLLTQGAARERGTLKCPGNKYQYLFFVCTIQYTPPTEMVNPCHQPYYHSKVWYGRTTPSDQST